MLNRATFFVICVSVLLGLTFGAASPAEQTTPPPVSASEAGGQVVQAHAILTVSEGKRLIAKAIPQIPVVKNALANGMVIVCKGTTNTYVAEELLGQKIPHGAMVIGNVTPQKGARRLPEVKAVSEVVLVKGKHRPDLSLDAALKLLTPEDVVMKGGNALDYANQKVGVWIGGKSGGTTGKITPYATAGKVHLIIPIGLEKVVSGRVEDIARRVNETATNLTELPNMRILPGQIVTEIEALKILAGVDTFQASSGGIGGAEGAVWLIWRGKREDVEKARQIVTGIQGEEPFVP